MYMLMRVHEPLPKGLSGMKKNDAVFRDGN
jgi:hypothetical protein